jgi:hypothetical protein
MSARRRGDRPIPKSLDWRAVMAQSAARAAPVFEQILGRSLAPAVPSFLRSGAGVRCGESSGIFFELEGDVAGCVALLFAEREARSSPAAASANEVDASLVLELANIVASQIVSGLADALRGRILLSLPSAVATGAERELARRADLWRDRSEVLQVEVAFRDRAGLTEYRLALIAELTADAGL